MKTLHLSLRKEPFEVMVTGEKGLEFRKKSKWIRSRLFNKDGTRKQYDVIKFVNGYGNDKPYFMCLYGSFIETPVNLKSFEYSNGLVVEGIVKGDFVILCGVIIKKGNLK